MKIGLLWSGCCTYYASTIGHSKKPNPVYRISPTIAEDVPLENDLGFVLSGWTFLFPTDFETSSGCIRALQLSSHNRPLGSWIDPINVKYFKMADMSIWSPSSQPSPLLTPTPQTFWIRHWCACTLTPNVCRVVICASDVKVLFLHLHQGARLHWPTSPVLTDTFPFLDHQMTRSTLPPSSASFNHNHHYPHSHNLSRDVCEYMFMHPLKENHCFFKTFALFVFLLILLILIQGRHE